MTPKVFMAIIMLIGNLPDITIADATVEADTAIAILKETMPIVHTESLRELVIAYLNADMGSGDELAEYLGVSRFEDTDESGEVSAP